MDLLDRLEAATSNDKSLEPVSTRDPQYLKISARLDRLAREYNPEDETAFLAHIEKMSEISLDTTSKTLINRRRRISHLWFAVVRRFDKNMPDEQMWYIQVVRDHLEKFLPVIVLITDPRKGHTSIRSTTLQSAYQTIIMLVCQHCINPVTNTKAGFILLTDNGMFIRLKKQLMGLITQYNLERSPHIKLYFGREHLHAILNCMILATESSGPVRLYVLQSGARFLLTFHTTCRPSTGGPTEEKWAAAGRYPKLSDLTIYRRGYMTFEIGIRLSNFKGSIATVEAEVQELVLHPVMYAHNVFLDPTNWFMALLFARGAFEKKYQTPQELYNDTDAQIKIDPAMLAEPLFREMATGGRGFSNEIKPATANSGTRAFGHWCVEAGLPRQGFYAMRRESSTNYYNQLGRSTARLLLNHGEEKGTAERFYVRKLSGLRLTSLKLGETAGPQESRPGQVLEESRQNHLFGDVVVESMLRFEGKNVKAMKRENRVKRRAKVDGHANVLEANLDIDNLYDEYCKCFTFQAFNYVLANKSNVTRIWKASQKEGKVIKIRLGAEEKAKNLKGELYNIFANRVATRQAINRTAVNADSRERTHQEKPEPRKDTNGARFDPNWPKMAKIILFYCIYRISLQKACVCLRRPVLQWILQNLLATYRDLRLSYRDLQLLLTDLF